MENNLEAENAKLKAQIEELNNRNDELEGQVNELDDEVRQYEYSAESSSALGGAFGKLHDAINSEWENFRMLEDYSFKLMEAQTPRLRTVGRVLKAAIEIVEERLKDS